MKEEFLFARKTHRNRGRFLQAFAALAAATLLLIPTAANALNPGESGPAGKSPVVTVEKIPGKATPRVILSAKAAERLGIETGKVGEEQVVRKQMVGGLLVPPVKEQPKSRPVGGLFGGFKNKAPSPEPGASQGVPAVAGDLWVVVALSPGEWDKLAKDKPVRLLPLVTRDNSKKEVWAQPSGMEPIEDMKRSMLSLYYVVSGKDHGLMVNHRVRVELYLAGSVEKRKVVPYSAVYYDAQGGAWVYVNTQPFTYERQRIAVERIEGDLAVLSSGPPAGSPVVTVGAPLLHGAEIFKK